MRRVVIILLILAGLIAVAIVFFASRNPRQLPPPTGVGNPMFDHPEQLQPTPTTQQVADSQLSQWRDENNLQAGVPDNPSILDGTWKDVRGNLYVISGPDNHLSISKDVGSISHGTYMPSNFTIIGSSGHATVKPDMSLLWWSNPVLNPPWKRVKASTTAP